MSVSTEVNAAGPFLCNGTQTEFPFAFPVLDAAHVAVYVNGDPVASGYTVSLTDDGVSGGTVIMETAPSNKSLLSIIRDVPITQLTDIQNHTAFLPEVIEGMADKLTMICQQLEEELSRCVKVPPGSSENADDLWETFDGIVETCLTSASNAATSAATAGTIASQIALIWTEITGDDSLFENAFATAKELMEAKGAVEAAASAGIAGVNEASLAALNAAKTEIEEAKDSSLETLDSTLQSASNNLNGIVSGADASLALKLAEAKGAATAAEAAQAAAANSGSAAQASADAASASAASAATKAGEAASSSSAALAAKQEAEAAKVAAVAAQVAAEAALGEGESLVNQSVTAHNANPQAHAGFLLPLAGGTMTGELKSTAYNTLRMIQGEYGTFFRNDGNSLYLMITNAGDQNGSYNDFRPLTINLSTGRCDINGRAVLDGSGNNIAETYAAKNHPAFSNGIEISGDLPYIDFHFNNDSGDFTSRIYETSAGNLTLIGNLNVTGKLTSAQGEGTFSGTGYQKLPGGLIIQWGEYTLATVSFTDNAWEENKVAFPIAFPSACLAMTADCHCSPNSYIGSGGPVNVRFDRTHYLIINSSGTNKRISWIAIGY